MSLEVPHKQVKVFQGHTMGADSIAGRGDAPRDYWSSVSHNLQSAQAPPTGLTWNNILRSAVNNNVNILGEASYNLEPKTVQQL